MRALHDLYCRECQYATTNHMVDTDAMPKCACGATLRVDWSHGKPPATDVLGSEQVSSVLDDADNTPLTWTSTRERDAKMKALGCEPAGDKEGGSRNESHLRLGKVFSFDNKAVKSSSDGRRDNRSEKQHGKRTSQPAA
jgi:hypothetical protein